MSGIILALLLVVSTGAAATPVCRHLSEIVSTPAIRADRVLNARTDLVVVSANAKHFFVPRPVKQQQDLIQVNPEPTSIRPKTDEAVKRLLVALHDVKADIVVTQEIIGSHSTRALDPNHEYLHITSTPMDLGHLQTMFMVRADLNVDAQLVVPPITAPHAKIFRGLPYIKLRQKDANGKVNRSQMPDLIVIGVHLAAYKFEHGQAHYHRNKEEEIHQIIKLKEDLELRFPGTKIIVAGDLNMDVNVRPEAIPIKYVLQDTLAFTKNPTDRESRTSQTFHTDGLTEPAQLDAIFMNSTALQHLTGSYVYRYRHSNGQEMIYQDAAGNSLKYPTTYGQRELRGYDHDLIVAGMDMTRTTNREIEPISNYQRTLRELYRELDRRSPAWAMNDYLYFKLELKGDQAAFARWFKENKFDSHLIISATGGNFVYIQGTFTALGYMLLRDSANRESWFKSVHFQAP